MHIGNFFKNSNALPCKLYVNVHSFAKIKSTELLICLFLLTYDRKQVFLSNLSYFVIIV